MTVIYKQSGIDLAHFIAIGPRSKIGVDGNEDDDH